MMIQTGARIVLSIIAPLAVNGFATAGVAKGVAFSTRSTYGSVPVPADVAHSTTSTSLRNVIRGLEEEDLIDEGLGGVTLAIESAILVSGQYDKTSDEFSLNDLTRYHELTEMGDSNNGSVIGAGTGDECYYDPGEKTSKQIDVAPIVAAREAVKSISASALENMSSLAVNVLGGDDLVINEAVEGALEVVRTIDLPSNCKVSMTSLCHSSIPATSASVTLVAGSDQGHIYQYDGKLWTVQESSLRTEIS